MLYGRPYCRTATDSQIFQPFVIVMLANSHSWARSLAQLKPAQMTAVFGGTISRDMTSTSYHPALSNPCTVASFHRDSALLDTARSTEASSPVTITNDWTTGLQREKCLLHSSGCRADCCLSFKAVIVTATMLQCLKNSRIAKIGAVLGYVVTESSPRLHSSLELIVSSWKPLRVLKLRLNICQKSAH